MTRFLGRYSRLSQQSVITGVAAFFKLTRVGFRFTWVWTPSHTGIPGIERANKLAKEAAKKYPNSREE